MSAPSVTNELQLHLLIAVDILMPRSGQFDFVEAANSIKHAIYLP